MNREHELSSAVQPSFSQGLPSLGNLGVVVSGGASVVVVSSGAAVVVSDEAGVVVVADGAAVVDSDSPAAVVVSDPSGAAVVLSEAGAPVVVSDPAPAAVVVSPPAASVEASAGVVAESDALVVDPSDDDSESVGAGVVVETTSVSLVPLGVVEPDPAGSDLEPKLLGSVVTSDSPCALLSDSVDLVSRSADSVVVGDEAVVLFGSNPSSSFSGATLVVPLRSLGSACNCPLRWPWLPLGEPPEAGLLLAASLLPLPLPFLAAAVGPCLLPPPFCAPLPLAGCLPLC